MSQDPAPRGGRASRSALLGQVGLLAVALGLGLTLGWLVVRGVAWGQVADQVQGGLGAAAGGCAGPQPSGPLPASPALAHPPHRRRRIDCTPLPRPAGGGGAEQPEPRARVQRAHPVRPAGPARPATRRRRGPDPGRGDGAWTCSSTGWS